LQRLKHNRLNVIVDRTLARPPHAPLGHAGDARIDGPLTCWWRWLGAVYVAQNLRQVLRNRIGKLASEEFVKDDAQSIDIRPNVYALGMARGLLRRHIRQSAKETLAGGQSGLIGGQRFGQSEVQNVRI